MKRYVRAVGIDDAPFKMGKDTETYLIATLVRAPNYLEALGKGKVKVDGMDATQEIKRIVEDNNFSEEMHVLMVEGACVAGFNPVDIEELHSAFQVPVVAITSNKPHPKKMLNALRSKFEDWKIRWEIIKKGKMAEVKTKGGGKIYIRFVGCELEEIKKILEKFTVRGNVPEPIRLADMIAYLFWRDLSHPLLEFRDSFYLYRIYSTI